MSKSKRIIGVTPLWDAEKDSLWMLPDYISGLQAQGAIPIILTFGNGKEELEELCSLCDGFLLTGGDDVRPSEYNEEPLPELIKDCPKRDELERIVLEYAIEHHKPVLGICRGLQFINVYYGGTLIQDIPLQWESEVNHRMKGFDPVDYHPVELTENQPLAQLLKKDSIMVNSYHHQGIKDLGKGVEIMAKAPDGLIEGIYVKDEPFIWGVQWHPERMWKSALDQSYIFRALIEACSGK